MTIKFSPQQLQVIEHKEGPISVIAGAGSGKSTVLVHRIKKLIENGVSQSEIVAITFTRNSANDLKKKLNSLGILDVNVGTFHSVLSKMLLENGVDVYKKVPMFEIRKRFNAVNFNSDLDDILSFISYQKCYMRGYNDVFVAKESAYVDYELSKYYQIYENLKKEKNAYDFDDYLLEALKILRVNPNAFKCQYLLVDEHQDNNMVQNLLMKEMCPSGNIMVVGDYRQAIYSFRGADPRYFMNFHKDYPNAKVVNLDNNYRSGSEIIDNANNFIRNYYGGYEYYSDSIATSDIKGKTTVEIYETAEDEAEDIANAIQNMLCSGVMPKDIAVLYRLNSMPHQLEMSLIKRNIPYHIENDNNFFKSKQLVPIISCLRLLEDNNDDEAFLDLLQTRCYPFTYVPKVATRQIEEYAFQHGISYLEASVSAPIGDKQVQTFIGFKNMLSSLKKQYHQNDSALFMSEKIIFALKLQAYIEQTWTGEEIERRKNSVKSFLLFTENATVKNFLKFVQNGKRTAKKSDENAVQLMTIHKSKGLEWNNVFVMGLQEGKFPSKKAKLEEEARLFYVAITRPKNKLFISQLGQYNTFCNQYKGLNIDKTKMKNI